MTANTPGPAEAGAKAAREERFAVLPDRVAFADLVEEKPALPANQAVDNYDPDSLGIRFSCLAADLGL
jgi:hypothetical protein